jgi:HEAT repeat protein
MHTGRRCITWQAVLGFSILLTPTALLGQCSEFKLLVPGGLRKGQSISILPFALLDPSSYPDRERDWYQQELRKLQENFAGKLSENLKQLGVFGEIRKFSADVRAQTDLTIEGALTAMRDVADGISVTVAATILRTSDGKEVLRMAGCSTTIKINVGSSFLRGSPGLLDSFLGNIATSIAETIPKVIDFTTAPVPAAEAKPARVEPQVLVQEALKRYRTGEPGARERAASALVAIGGPAVDPLVLALEDAETVGLAAWVLGQIKDPRALKPLVGMLQSPHHGRLAAETLGELGDPSAIPPLIAALKYEDARYGALIALGKLKASTAVPILVSMLDSGALTDSEKSRLIDTLGEIGDPRATAPLVALMNRSTTVWRSTIVGALGGIGDAAAVAVLVTALRDRDEGLQNQAQWAFSKVRPQYGCDPLLQLLDDPDPRIRNSALTVLERMSGKVLGADKHRWQKWCDESK